MEQTETQTEQTEQTETELTESIIELAIVAGETPKIVKLTPIGLDIPEDLTFEEWTELMASIHWHHKKLTIACADGIEYGNKHYGLDKVNQVLEQLEFELPMVKAAIAINSIPIDLRYPNLTADHYVELARADVPKKDKAKWAEIAARLRLTATQLRLSMAEGEVVDTAAARAMSTGIITIPGIRQEFDVWLHRVGGIEGVRKMDTDTQQEIMEELEPIIDFAVELERAMESITGE